MGISAQACWVFFHVFVVMLSSADLFEFNFKKTGIISENTDCRTVWIQIRTDRMGQNCFATTKFDTNFMAQIVTWTYDIKHTILNWILKVQKT